MYDDTMTVDKAYYNELKDKAAACEFWYQKYHSLYPRLVGLRDRIEKEKFFNQRAGRGTMERQAQGRAGQRHSKCGKAVR